MKQTNLKQNILASTMLGAIILTAGMVYYTLAVPSGANKTVLINPMTAVDIMDAKELRRDGDWEQSAKLLSTHAYGSDPQAQYEFAYQIVRGWGLERDLDAALNLLLSAVQHPFPDRAKAAFELARIYRMSTGENCQTLAFEWFVKSANWGYSKSHLEIGKAYMRGLGVAPSFEDAIKHYRIASESGSASGVFSLVALLEKGMRGTSGDVDIAREVLNDFMPMLEAEASSGNGRAARTIARIYQSGTLRDKNMSLAVDWFTKGANAGDSASMHDLAVIMTDRLEAQTQDISGLSQDHSTLEQEIIQLLKDSANKGYGGAMTALGRAHLSQKFDLKLKGAIEWFEQGVSAGHAGSMEELAHLLIDGKIVKRDIPRARKLAAQGAKLRHPGSINLLETILAARNSTQEGKG